MQSLSEAEKIKRAYDQRRSTASPTKTSAKGDARETATLLSVPKQFTPSHRKYASSGEIAAFRTESPRNHTRSYTSAATSISGPSSLSNDRSDKSTNSHNRFSAKPRSVHPLSGGQRTPQDDTERPTSPTKRHLAPRVAERLSQFNEPLLPASATDAMTKKVPRIRAKSLGESDSMSSAAYRASASPAPPPLPQASIAFPQSRSTGELVKLYEQKAASPNPLFTSDRTSPVKDWLQKVKESSAKSTPKEVLPPLLDLPSLRGGPRQSKNAATGSFSSRDISGHSGDLTSPISPTDRSILSQGQTAAQTAASSIDDSQVGLTSKVMTFANSRLLLGLKVSSCPLVESA